MGAQDFDWIVAKLPRKDKNGNDTSYDKLGIGGKHRKDGTFSSMPYDIEICEDGNPVEKTNELKSRIEEIETFDTNYTVDERTTSDVMVDLAESLADLSENIFNLVEWGLEIRNRWKERKRKQLEASNVNDEDLPQEDVEVLDDECNVVSTNGEIVENNESIHRQIELTIDEARLIFIGMLVNYMKFKKDYNMLASANIKGVPIEIRSFDDVISFFDRCIDIYPQLMDSATSSIVNSILETNLDANEIILVKKALNMVEI